MTLSHIRCLRGLLEQAGWAGAPLDRLDVTPSATLIASDQPIADIATATLSAAGLAFSAVDGLRTGRVQRVSVDRGAASLAMASADYLRIDGAAPEKWDPVTGYYRCRDGWAYLHGNFAHLRDGLLALFDAPSGRDDLTARLAGLTAQEVEDRAAEQGLCAVRLRTREDWQVEAQAEALRALPVVRIARIGDAPPEPLPPGELPLSGVRALDLTRVIAGPMAGRTLAGQGAEVLRIASPNLPFIEPLVIDTGFGKRSAHLDLDTGSGRDGLVRLLREADVFVDAYRPGALAKRGFGPPDLAELRPGIVSVSISAFSSVGPWRGRRGYDTLVQAATGLASVTGDGPPKRLPCQPLDYLSGYLAAFGATVALMRRMTEGGSWHVEVALARTAQWIWDMRDALGTDASPPEANPEPEEISALTMECDSPFGRLSVLRPAFALSENSGLWARPPVPLGTDSPEWL